MLTYNPDSRIYWPLFLLNSIPHLSHRSLLILGPRFETEILLSKALGWESIKSIDTYSYSPLITTGDMHELDFNDNTFSAILCGWTISYSSNPSLAAKEIIRVLEPGGVVAIAVQKVPLEAKNIDIVPGVLTGTERIQTLIQ